MATVVFPPNPSIGDTVTDPATGTVWMWDGYKWTFAPPGSGGGGGSSGPPFQGVTDGTNAAPGMIGECIESQPSAQFLPSGTMVLIGSLDLPAGDWDVSMTCSFTLAFSTPTTIITQLDLNGSPLIPASQNMVPQLTANGLNNVTNYAYQGITCQVNIASPGTLNVSASASYTGQVGNPTGRVFFHARRAR